MESSLSARLNFPRGPPTGRLAPARRLVGLASLRQLAYGGVNTSVALAVLAVAIRPEGGYDAHAMMGHAYLWDPAEYGSVSDPGRGDTLRVNGRARLVRDAPFFDDLLVRGHRPELAVVVHVEDMFLHCPKAFLCSQLWDPSTWAPQATVPQRAVIARDVGPDGRTLAELDEYYGPAYEAGLFG